LAGRSSPFAALVVDYDRWLVFRGSSSFPRSLAPLNRAWFRLGLVLNRIVSPIVMGGLFFCALVPIGWYLRKSGKDLLSLKLDRNATTYWIERNPPGPAPNSLTKQFQGIKQCRL
jgi:hypothetical protein